MPLAAVRAEEHVYRTARTVKADGVARNEGAIQRRPIDRINALQLSRDRTRGRRRDPAGTCKNLVKIELFPGPLALVAREGDAIHVHRVRGQIGRRSESERRNEKDKKDE